VFHNVISWERDARTTVQRLPISVGLAQARPNYHTISLKSKLNSMQTDTFSVKCITLLHPRLFGFMLSILLLMYHVSLLNAFQHIDNSYNKNN